MKKMVVEQAKNRTGKKAEFSDSKTAEDNLTKTLGLTPKKKKAFNVVDDSDESLAAALKDLKKELNKISANPVFNPDLHKAAFCVGMIYLQRGSSKFADWSRQMVEAVGEKIRPWLGSVWKSIEVYPKNEKLDPEIMSIAIDFTGSNTTRECIRLRKYICIWPILSGKKLSKHTRAISPYYKRRGYGTIRRKWRR